MNKTELIGKVAAASGQTLKESTLAVNAVLHVLTATLQQGDKVMIPGFGSFSVKERPARMGRNPRTGAQIKIAAKKVVKFNPGAGLDIASKPSVKTAKPRKK